MSRHGAGRRWAPPPDPPPDPPRRPTGHAHLREFDLLAFLTGHPGQAFSREDLMSRVWGWSFGDSSTVTVHVRRVREKIETDPTAPVRLVTVWGIGYRWDPAS